MPRICRMRFAADQNNLKNNKKYINMLDNDNMN